MRPRTGEAVDEQGKRDRAVDALHSTIVAAPEQSILRFTGMWRFLSNMDAAPCFYEDAEYPTVEHAFQAAKCHPHNRAVFQKRHGSVDGPIGAVEVRQRGGREHLSAVEAKQRGQRVPLSTGELEWWHEHRVEIMYRCVQSKFSRSAMGALLVLTGDRHLSEGNDWGDTFWGVTLGANPHGLNHLGQILMAVRTELVASGRHELDV